MEQFHYGSQRREEADELNLREWPVRARIKRENTSSRRFSGSYIRSFGEDGRSFRSNLTISSTASSPGCYSMRDEIDPSTYSFTTALKGEVPMECLSAKTLSARSFRNFRTRITMSAPLVYSTNSRQIQERPISFPQEEAIHHYPIPEKKMEGMRTKDVGTQSTPPDRSSTSPSPASTPPIKERSLKECGKEQTGSSKSYSIPQPSPPYLLYCGAHRDSFLQNTKWVLTVSAALY